MSEEYDSPLDELRDFVSETLYLKPEQTDAVALAIAASHATDAFITIPRILVTAEHPQSGKSTLLDVAMMTAGNPLDGAGTAPGLTAAFINNDGRQPLTLVRDEISQIFNRNGLGGQKHPLYDPLVRGYRKSATVLFSSGHQANLVSIYGMAWLAGLGVACPADLRSRSIHIKMQPKPESMILRPTGAEDTLALGKVYQDALHRWTRAQFSFLKDYARNTPLHRIHPKLSNRRAEIWCSLFAVATMAGGSWPARCLMAFEALALDESDRPVVTPLQQVLLDMADVFRVNGGTKFLPVKTLYDGLLDMPHAGELYDQVSAKTLLNLMQRAAGQDSTPKWDASQGKTVRVRFRDDIVPAADRLMAVLYPEPEVTSDAPEQWEIELGIADDPEADADGLKRSRASRAKAEAVKPSEPVSDPAGAQARLNAMLGK